MTTLAIDTYRILQRLESKGYSREQAEGFLEVLQGIDFDHLATKADLASATKDLRADMREMELRLESRIKDTQLHIGAMIVALGGILIAIRYFA